MKAIPEFTLPKLDVPAGQAIATDVSSPAQRLKAPAAANTGDQKISIEGDGKEFGELVNSRIVKKETGRESNFDGSRQIQAGSGDDTGNDLEFEQAVSTLAPTVQGQAPKNNSLQIDVKLVADSLPGMAGIEHQSNPAIPGGTVAESLTAVGKSADTGSASQRTTPGGTSEISLKSAVETLQPSDRAAITRILMPANGDAVIFQQSDRIAETQTRTPVSSDAGTRQLESNATSIHRPELQSLTNETEALVSEQYRTLKPAAAEIANRSARSVAVMPSDVGEAEFAAPGGKELPAGGKPLPSVLMQTPAQFAPGLNGRTELMTRAVGSGRPRSIGKETVEVPGLEPGLEKIAQIGNRAPLTEAFTKLASQVQLTASTDMGMNSQTTSSDSQAAGLLAQHLAGVEKASITRGSSPLTGLDSSNSFSLQLQPGNQEVSAQLGSRIRWMGNLNISSAEIKLYPAELGTLEILITAEDDQARVNFITSTSAAKEMIEASLPRLRELLGQSGMLLEQGDVTHRDLSKNDSDNALPSIERQAAESLETETLEAAMPMYQRSASDHRIDHFA